MTTALLGLAAWAVLSVVTALGVGWVLRRFPPPDHSPRESSTRDVPERDRS